MIDTGVSWVRDYKLSGFRFDLMSLHRWRRWRGPRRGTRRDPTVYIYGEGWNNPNWAIYNDRALQGRTARPTSLARKSAASSDPSAIPLQGRWLDASGSGDNLVRNQGFSTACL